MSLSTAVIIESLTSKLFIICGLLLISFLVQAEDEARLELSPTYREMLTDDIYENSDDWRKPPMFESEWRVPKTQENSRIKYGYDSAYEELRLRNDTYTADPGIELREPKPNTLFRFNF